MKCIDRRGFTYTVYDLGNGRVLKKEKPFLLQYLLHRSHGHTKEYVLRHFAQARLLASVCSDKELLGNPEFTGKRSYTQDVVTVIDSYFSSHTLEENKAIVDGFIQCVFDTWKSGFSDIIFNFTRNNGVTSGGRVILIDFNEVTFRKGDVRALMESERWLHCYSYTRDLPDGALKAYYAEAMAKAMTLENLDRYWKDNEQLLGKTQ